MCGIAGFVGEGTQAGLEKMAARIKHRGPDAQGVFFDRGVGLAHARLSVIDLSPAGGQPMFNEGKTAAIVFNGEIYNFPALKKELKEKGHTFKSTSDTEVVLCLYDLYGEQCFEKMAGMFAIAIFDFSKKKLILARDRIGEKPLYWAKQNDVFVFASELGALMDSGLISKEIDLVSLNKYLLFDYVPTPATILKDVYKLEPGTYLVYENDNITKQSFWHQPTQLLAISENKALARLDELFDNSIAGQLISDAPLGVFLSGGIDSSTVAWYAQQHSNRPIDTFSIGFSDVDFDESTYAREVANHLGTKHHEQIITPKDALAMIEEIPDVLTEPMADASVIPTLLLSRFARGYVTVSLGGDGGDELFAGYPTFQAEPVFRIYRAVPDVLKSLIRNIINWLPAGDGNFGFVYNLKKLLSSKQKISEYRHSEWLGSFPEDERIALTNGALREVARNADVFEEIGKYRNEYNQPDSLNRILYTYLRSYLMDEVLVKVDRASMHYALEVRAPMLDHRITEFVFSLSSKLKYHNFRTKQLLKKLMKGRLPNNILNRKKKGFGIPLAKWLKNELKPLCEELLNPAVVERQGLFNHQYVSKLIKDHLEGRTDNRKQLWNLMVFQMWYNRWIKQI